MDAGFFVLLLFLAFVALLVVNLMRVRQLSHDVQRLDGDIDKLQDAVLHNAQICKDIATAPATPVMTDTPTDDLQVLLDNPLVQQVLERR